MFNILNLIATVILFYTIAHLIGRIVVQKIKIELSHSASIGLVLISTVSSYFAYLKIDFKWLSFCLLAVAIWSLISRFRKLMHNINYTNGSLITLTSILITTILFLNLRIFILQKLIEMK